MTKSGLNHDDSRSRLLDFMKLSGGVTLEEAVQETGLARTTLREHLAMLERDGWVQHEPEREGRGRPRLRYSLTPRGHRLYPTRDGELLREMIRFLIASGKTDLVETFFETYWDRRYREVKHRLDLADVSKEEDRVRVIREILEEEGFMPQAALGEDGEVIIQECNCPFPEAVKATRLPCRLEAAFFERVMDRKPHRITYIPDGHHACTYEFGSATEERD